MSLPNTYVQGLIKAFWERERWLSQRQPNQTITKDQQEALEREVKIATIAQLLQYPG